MTDSDLDAMSARLAEPWYVVGPPWGDGTWVVSGNEDPHVGRFVCDAMAGDGGDEDGPSAQDLAEAVARTREDARALLAECRRLRGPPDVSGLMTAAELDALRAKVAHAAREREAAALPAWRTDRAALLAHADAQAALIRELYGVIADLHADDPGRQALLGRGRAEGREQAAHAVLTADVPGGFPSLPHLEGDARLAAARLVRDLGPCRPPLPPQEAEAEAGRLREALRAVAAAGDIDAPYGAMARALAAARTVLRGEAR